VASVLAEIQEPVELRLLPLFSRARVHYPPQRVWLLAFKEEERLEVWASGPGQRPSFIREYPIQRTSGYPGPKLQEGDFQVPEGVYRVLWLNPASSYHLSMKLDYPNDFDRAMARSDGRTHLGGDIFIHGSNESVGCLAMGDEVIEELFVLAARVGVENTTALIAPRDLRTKDLPEVENRPPWVGRLYASLIAELRRFAR
jgi:murein L,D-transpeptidase YafK